MTTPLVQAGALPAQSRYAPIHTNRFFTGLWTQRNPLRDAATPYLYEKFYAGSRYDSLIAGFNAELTTRLTIGRRPGLSLYNSNSFAPIRRFYSFRRFKAGGTAISVIADTDANVYDATSGTQRVILAKSVGSGRTSFQSVGNELFMGDGLDQQMYVAPLTAWRATTAFTAGQFIVDTNFNIQQCTTGGTTGSVQPTWATGVRATTADSGVTWTNRGSATQYWGEVTPASGPTVAPGAANPALRFWQPLTAISTPYAIQDKNGGVLQAIVNGGTTGSTYPNFLLRTAQSTSGGSNFSPNTPDGSQTWRSLGPAGAWQASFNNNAQATVILDPNGNWQITFSNGTTGGSQPSWSTGLGATTTDGGVTWTCYGPATKVATDYQYAFSYHDVDGHVGSASSIIDIGPTVGNLNYSAVIGGPALAAGKCDAIWIWRTANGGSTLLFLASIPNPGTGNWTYTDSLPDSALNAQLQAPIAGVNNPPPAGLINIEFHNNRLWGSVGNVVYYTTAPNVNVGSNFQSWPSLNAFTFPAYVTRLKKTSLGLLVFTVSDVYIITGQGTSTSPYNPVPFLEGFGLQNYDALTVNGTTLYMHTTDNQVISFDPGAGTVEVGFPIGDQFEDNYSPASSYVTWHNKGSRDKALYVADGTTGWFRMMNAPAPETGIVWSPKATIAAGCGCVQSVEVSPGVKQLLVSNTVAGPILQRDRTVNTDNASTFSWGFTIGSLVLAHGGQTAEIAFITADSQKQGTRPTIGVLLGEIAGTFTNLTRNRQDPPLLPASTSLFNDRYVFTNQQPVFCRHLQISFSWKAENFAQELLTYSIYGALLQERTANG